MRKIDPGRTCADAKRTALSRAKLLFHTGFNNKNEKQKIPSRFKFVDFLKHEGIFEAVHMRPLLDALAESVEDRMSVEHLPNTKGESEGPAACVNWARKSTTLPHKITQERNRYDHRE